MKSLRLQAICRDIGGDKEHILRAPPGSSLVIAPDGNPRFVMDIALFTMFQLLPAATIAAGADQVLKTLGTGTEVVARSTKGGANIKTQASSPADNDNALLIGTAGTNSFVTTAATINPRFRTRVNLSQITELVFGAGLDENITTPIPNGTAGDGAAFMFDPLNESVTGLTGAEANWILCHKVAGTDYFVDSGVPVAAGQDYELEIRWAGLTASFYINGEFIATAGHANTTATALGINVGVQISGTPSGQKDFDCRYVQLDRDGTIVD